VEDLDHPKVKPETVNEIYTDLKWLGLDWDEGPDLGGNYAPYIQSRRNNIYSNYKNILLKNNLIYPCTCSRKDVQTAMSAPHREDAAPVYPGTCKGRYNSYSEAEEALDDGRMPAWRFHTPDKNIIFTDKFAGRQSFNPGKNGGDFVIGRYENAAGYQLAVVIDDAGMNITEVLRGDDLIESTHRQILLYEALGLKIPEFIHVPLVTGEDGRRLAKRHGDTKISTIRNAGTTPERVIGLLAHWSGLCEYGAELTPQQLVSSFSLSKIPDNPVVLTENDKHYLGL
jgi:glutamyl-tRNA synthetase